MALSTVQNHPPAAFEARNLHLLRSKSHTGDSAGLPLTCKVFDARNRAEHLTDYLNSEYCAQVMQSIKCAKLSKVDDYQLPRSNVKHPFAIRGNLYSVYSEDCKDEILLLDEEDPKTHRLLYRCQDTVLDFIRFDQYHFLAADCRKQLLLFTQPQPGQAQQDVSMQVLEVKILNRTEHSQLSLYGSVFQETAASIYAIGIAEEADDTYCDLLRLSKKSRGHWEFLRYRDISSFCVEAQDIYLITQDRKDHTGVFLRLREEKEGVFRLQTRQPLAASINNPIQKLTAGQVFLFGAGYHHDKDFKKRFTVIFVHFKNLELADTYEMASCNFFLTQMIATRHAGLDFLFVLDQTGFCYIFHMKGKRLQLLQTAVKDHWGVMFGMRQLDPRRDHQLQTADLSKQPLFFLQLGDYRMMRVIRVDLGDGN